MLLDHPIDAAVSCFNSFRPGQEAKKPLTNADVGKLVQASLPEITIVLIIEQRQKEFDT